MKFHFLFLAAFLFITSHLHAQETPPASPPEEFKTNSGETFKDPFADPDAPESAGKPEAAPASTPESTPVPGPQDFPSEGPPNSEAAPVPPEPPVERLPAPPPLPAAPITAPAPKPALPSPSDFNFPDVKEPKGPRTQDIDPIRELKVGTKIGTWNLGFDLGAGTNFNRRPNQFHFEVEGGYRLYENIDFNGIIETRFMKDRILGFYFMPNYSWRISAPYKNYRVDLRAGLGTGWVFRGFKGNSYQTGYLPIRTSFAGVFYPSAGWAFVVSLDVEVFLLRVDSDGKTRNELGNSKGPPAQLIPTVGVRWEF